MLYGEKSREELNAYAEKLFSRLKRKDKQELYKQLTNQFNMPTITAENAINFKRDIKEFTTFEIFCLVWFLDRDSLKKFFTTAEIESFSKSKFPKSIIQFPLTIEPLVQVTEDQWIGKIDVSKLIKLRNSGFINYEENQQRALRIVKYSDIEIYRPYVNNVAVKEIKESMEAGYYVPDPITLNMPEGSEYSFENGTLTIFSLPNGMLNLLDGYHRTLALSMILDFNPDFDMQMELRIVNFSQSKAEQFIYQADQKTQMKKITSDSYNPNDLGNMICQRLNEDGKCNISGMIGRNNAKINLGELSTVVTHFYVKGRSVNKEERMSFVIATKNVLRDAFNVITEEDPMFLGKYDTALIYVVIFVFANCPAEKYTETIKETYNSLTEEEKKLFTLFNGVRRKAVSVLEKKVGK